MSEKETVKVAFVKDKENGEIVAIFPDMLHGLFSSTVVCYTHSEQHSSCDKTWAREQEKTSADEITPLYNELRGRGYDMILTNL